MLWTLIAAAAAQDCDVKALETGLAGAAPAQLPAVYLKLAECDAVKAKAAAAKTVPRFIGDTAAYEAARAAVNVGAGEHVAAWMKGLQADERAKAVSTIGDGCSAQAAEFFVGLEKATADAFWADRWYRGLEECRTPAAQGLLQGQVDKGVGSDRARFAGVLETYAKNLGAASIPKLEALLAANQDPEIVGYVLGAFDDAASVGSEKGPDPKAASAAAEAISRSTLPAKSILQARAALQALGDEAGADAMAGRFFQDSAQSDGTFLWGVVAVETATCKNGKTAQGIHPAQVVEGGTTWPDQLEEKVRAAGGVAWEFKMATGCKGSGTISWAVSPAPFADVAAWKAWVDGQVKATEAAAVDKRVRFDHDPLRI